MVMLNHGDFSFELLHPHAAILLDELAENEAQRKEAEAAEFDAAIAKRKEKVAAAKAKRIAEETAKATE